MGASMCVGCDDCFDSRHDPENCNLCPECEAADPSHNYKLRCAECHDEHRREAHGVEPE